MRVSAFAAVMAAALVIAPNAFASNAVFGGAVTKGEPIVLTADAKAKVLKTVTVAFDPPCPNGARVPPYAAKLGVKKVAPGFPVAMNALGVTKNAGGKFSGTVATSANGNGVSWLLTMSMSGKLSKTKASGTMFGSVTEVTDAGETNMTCETGVLKWTASRKAGFIYGGATSQSEPVVLRLNSSKRKVADFIYSWASECVPEGFFHDVFEPLTNFGVTSKGIFGDSWSSDYQRDDGGTNRWSYALTGKVGKTAASGTLQTSLTDLNSSGGADHTCDSGRLTWKAMTG